MSINEEIRNYPNLFQAFHQKSDIIINRLVKFHANLVTLHSVKIILGYIVFAFLLSLGLFQIQINMDTESLAYVRNSPSLKHAQLINDTFGTNQRESHYNNKLLHLGWYFEFMINVRGMHNSTDFLSQEFNLINETILHEYNQLFDEIMSIRINDPDTNGPKNLCYINDLCARRLEKCSIEGGVIRHAHFQKKFLSHNVFIMKNDHLQTYVDIQTTDAINFPLIFGNFIIKESKYKNTRREELHLVHASTIRNRFDLLATSKKEKELAIEFMKAYVEYMDSIRFDQTKFPHLSISYFSSHALSTEIEKYSKFDVPYLILSFIAFWILFLISFVFQTVRVKSNLEVSNQKLMTRLFEKLQVYMCTFSIFCVAFIQVVLTIASAFGALALMGVNPNLLTPTILFIVTIVSCNQSYLIYSNMNRLSNKIIGNHIKNTNINRDRSESPASTSLQSSDNDEKSDFLLNQVEKVLFILIKQFLVPIIFSSLASILCYSILSATTAFDSIRIYGVFANFSLLINVFSLALFYFPICSIYLKKVNSKQIAFMMKCPNLSIQNSSSNSNTKELEKLPNGKLALNKSNGKKESKFSKICDYINEKCERFSLFNILFASKIKWIILVTFFVYASVNFMICIKYFKVDLPIIDLIPKESFLRQHMVNHMELFSIAPIIIITIFKPISYWKPETYEILNNLSDATMNYHMVDNRLKVFWLDDLYANAESKAAFFPSCKAPIEYSCFFSTFRDNTLGFQFYEDDVSVNASVKKKNFVANESDPFDIYASRLYFQMKSFTGTQAESDMMHDLNYIANEYAQKLNLSSDSIITYSAVYIFLEQFEEVLASFITMIILNIEFIIFTAFFIIFDLRSLLILLTINISLITSIISNMFLINLSLNISTLYHFLILPALLSEFFLYTAYSFTVLNGPKDGLSKNPSTSEMKSLVSGENSPLHGIESDNISMEPRDIEINHSSDRLNRLRIIFDQYIVDSSIYLFNVAMVGFGFMIFCTTYNFNALFWLLMIFIFNILIHLFLFYPILLLFLGTCWKRS